MGIVSLISVCLLDSGKGVTSSNESVMPYGISVMVETTDMVAVIIC